MSYADSTITKAGEVIYSNPESAEKMFCDAQKHVSDSDAFYLLEVFKGTTRWMLGDEKGKQLACNATESYIKRNPKSHKVAGAMWNHKAIYEVNTGNRSSALAYYKRSYDEISQTNELPKLIDLCINMADVNLQSANQADAIRFYKRALFLADSLNQHDADYSILTGLGSTYAELGNYSKSTTYFTKASKVENLGTVYDKFFHYNVRGTSLYYQKKYPEAMASFKKACIFADSIAQPDLRAIAEGNLGEVYMLNGNLDSANVYIKRTEKQFKSIKPVDPGRIFYINSLLTDLHLRENNLGEAKKYMDLNPDTVTTMPRYLALHFHRLENYFRKSGNYKQAYNTLNRAIHFDSIFKGEIDRNQIVENEYRYKQDTLVLHNKLRMEAKESEVTHLHTAMYALALALIILVVSTIIYLNFRKRRRELVESNLRNKLYAIRMETVRNRISPHFIFNVLNRELDLKNPGVCNLVDLLHKSLKMCQRYKVPLSDELDFINTYILAEQGAIGDDFHYTCKVDPNIDTTKVELPSMMLQIFIENAVKHALRGVEGYKYLNLSVSKIDKTIKVEIMNNGNLIKNSSSKSDTRLGMQIVTQTIQILNEKNKNKIQLNYGMDKGDDGETIWKVTIIVPDDYDYCLD